MFHRVNPHDAAKRNAEITLVFHSSNIQTRLLAYSRFTCNFEKSFWRRQMRTVRLMSAVLKNAKTEKK